MLIKIVKLVLKYALILCSSVYLEKTIVFKPESQYSSSEGTHTLITVLTAPQH